MVVPSSRVMIHGARLAWAFTGWVKKTLVEPEFTFSFIGFESLILIEAIDNLNLLLY